jgi:FkbM family methyltransferase
MTGWLSSLDRMRSRCAAQPKPLRWLATRVYSEFLYRTGLCSRFTIDRNLYRIHFSKSAMALAMWWHPEYWVEEESFYKSRLRPGDVFIDVGANIGVNALLAAALVGSAGKVIAIEAHPTTFAHLERNVRLNGFLNVVVRNAAVGSQAGSLELSTGLLDDSQNHVLSDTGGTRGIVVPVEPLDAILAGHRERIDLLKVDVEGYEKPVFEGAPETLARTRAIYFEVYERNFERFGYSTRDVLCMLDEGGFAVQRPTPQGNIPVPRDFRAERCTNLLAIRRD